MPKLTLSVDADVIERAKQFASEHDTSVSAMVQSYLKLVVQAPAEFPGAPIVSGLRGRLKGARVGDYKDYLERKHGGKSK